MARKGYGRNSTLVNITTHADDGTSPVGSNEWNENPKTDGVFGLTKNAQAISGNNNIVVTDSYIEITTADSASGGSNDGIYTLSAGTASLSATNYASDSTSSISEGDLIYVVKAASQATTSLVHQQGGSGGAGKITTLTGENKELSATVPTILMARTIGSVLEWVEYGGGTASDLDTTNFAAATIVTQAEGIANNDNETTLPTSAAVKDYVDTQILTKDDTDEIVEGSTNLYYTEARVNANSNVAANTLKTGISTAQADLLSATAGTATASKALVVDSNKDLTGVRNLTVAGDLTVSGTTTTVNVEDLTVDTADITIMNGNTTAASADNSGIKTQIGASSFKTLLWKHATSAWTSSDNIDSTEYKIAGTTVLSGSTLGSTITGSSLTSVGTIGTGTWQGTAIAQAYIGADAINGDKIANNAVDSEHITAGAVDIAHLSATGTASSTTFLRGDGQWQSAGGGTNTTVDCLLIDNADTNTVVPTYSTRTENSTSTPIQIYVQTIDSNNEGVYIRVKKNGTYTNVQIA